MKRVSQRWRSIGLVFFSLHFGHDNTSCDSVCIERDLHHVSVLMLDRSYPLPIRMIGVGEKYERWFVLMGGGIVLFLSVLNEMNLFL